MSSSENPVVTVDDGEPMLQQQPLPMLQQQPPPMLQQQQQRIDKRARKREQRIRRKERMREKKLSMDQTLPSTGFSFINPTTQKSIGDNGETTQNGFLTVKDLNTNLNGNLPATFSTEFQSGTTKTPAACTQNVGIGDGNFPPTSKRKSDCTPEESKKAKVLPSTAAEGIGLETIGITSPATVDHAHLWNPEFFIGGNPRLGPLRVDHSALKDEAAAAGLIYGARLPNDITYFSECKDAWEIYTHMAKCLAGAIGASTELHNRAVRHSTTTPETDKLQAYIGRLEEELARKNAKLEEATEVINQRAKRIANQGHYLDGLLACQKQMKITLAEKNEHCKRIEQQYDQECQKHQALRDAYNQLLNEKKEQENPQLLNEKEQENPQLLNEKKEQENPSIEELSNTVEQSGEKHTSTQ